MQANAELALILVPLFAFAEACIGIGLLISGAFLLVICTTLFSSGIATLQAIVPLAMAGAMVGDHVGFYTGIYLGPRLHHLRLAEKHRDRLARAESMIRRQGSWAIFIGRFIPAIRSLIPAALGISGFDRIRYSLLDAIACCLWASALGGIVWALDAGLFQ
ncbi:MAG: DedA family protein [Pseudohongiellaceae bacterium]